MPDASAAMPIAESASATQTAKPMAVRRTADITGPSEADQWFL
jgi:hypothetical protein